MRIAHNRGPLYDYEGEQLPLGRIALLAKVSAGRLAYRVKRGMTVREAIDTPDQRTRRARQAKEAV